MSIPYNRSLILDDFLKNAKEATEFNAIRRKIYLEHLKETYSIDYLVKLGYDKKELESVGVCNCRKHALRAAQTWAMLANQVVGAEVF